MLRNKQNKQTNNSIPRPLASSRRTLRAFKVFTAGSWQSIAGLQYSTDYQLTFKLSDFGAAGLNTYAQIFDQIQVNSCSWRITKLVDFSGSAGDTAKPRSFILYSTYDPDGSTLGAPLEILQRANMETFDITLDSPTVMLRGNPAYVNNDSEVTFKPLFDLNGGGLSKQFYSHSVVLQGANVQPGTEISFVARVDVDVTLIGKR